MPKRKAVKKIGESPNIEKICGYCEHHDDETGRCYVWAMPTDSRATCDLWRLKEDDDNRIQRHSKSNL